MNSLLKKILSLTALLSVVALQASDCNRCCDVTSCFVPRSQSRDKTRQMVGSVGHTHLYDMESWYGTFSVMYEYTRSFRPRDIASCLFGCSLNDNCDCPQTVKVQGSNVANRDPKAWLADYFYLPRDFQSTLSFEPRIQNHIVDFDFYLGLDEWASGLYFRIYGPIVHTVWNLNFCECVDVEGTNSHPAGYFAPEAIENANLLKSFEAYACGQTPSNVDSITFQPLKFDRMFRCKETKTGFADLRFELGWDFLSHEDYHLGVNVQAAAPTGNRKDCCLLFGPLVGNGNHWELGAGLTFHYVFWRSHDEEKHFGFYFDGNVTHLFKTTQCRTFDLCGKPLSRYALAAKMKKPVEQNLQGTDNRGSNAGTAPSAQFAGEFAPVANITTLDTKVSIGAQGDLVAMFNFTARGFGWDVGYNFWGRSCEKFECPDPCDRDCNNSCGCPSVCDTSQENTWVLKGDARVFGFAANDPGNPLVANQAVALSASQSGANICGGTNAGVVNAEACLADPLFKENFGVDNAKFAVAGANNRMLLHAPNTEVANDPANQIKTSVNPIFIECKNLNLQATRGLSHKIFTHFSYTWDRENWIPYVGVGGMAEFGKKQSKCCDPCDNECKSCCPTSSSNTSCTGCTTTTSCDPCCSNCIDCSLSQWGVWVKGGVSFN